MHDKMHSQQNMYIMVGVEEGAGNFETSKSCFLLTLLASKMWRPLSPPYWMGYMHMMLGRYHSLFLNTNICHFHADLWHSLIQSVFNLHAQYPKNCKIETHKLCEA